MLIVDKALLCLFIDSKKINSYYLKYILKIYSYY